jgi:hypothetical protein
VEPILSEPGRKKSHCYFSRWHSFFAGGDTGNVPVHRESLEESGTRSLQPPVYSQLACCEGRRKHKGCRRLGLPATGFLALPSTY